MGPRHRKTIVRGNRRWAWLPVYRLFPKDKPGSWWPGPWSDKDEGDLRLWEVAWDAKEGLKSQGIAAAAKGHAKGVLCVALSPDGRPWHSGRLDRTAVVWDLGTKQAKTRPQRPRRRGPLPGLFSQGTNMVTGGSDGKVRRWDVAMGKENSPPLEAHAGAVNAVAFFLDMKEFIITAGEDHSLRFWSAKSGDKAKNLFNHRSNTQAITSLAASPKPSEVPRHRLALGSNRQAGEIRARKTFCSFFRNCFTFTGLDAPVLAVAVSANNLILAIAGEDGNIRFRRAANRLPSDALIAAWRQGIDVSLRRKRQTQSFVLDFFFGDRLSSEPYRWSCAR